MMPKPPQANKPPRGARTSSSVIGLRRVATTLVAVALLVMAAVAVAPASSAADGDANKANVIIGFRSGVDTSAITSLGGTVTKTVPGLSLAGAKVPDRPQFIEAILRNPNVAFVETNDRIVRASGSTADGIGWDGTGWDGTGWDGTSWDTATADNTSISGIGWDGTGWDGTGWDGIGWDGIGWDGIGWDGTAWDGTAWNGIGWDGIGWDGIGWDGIGWDGINYTGIGWDGTGWDSNLTGWSSIDWNGIGWDGIGWDGIGWDGVGWDGAQWDGSVWNATWLSSKATANNGDPLHAYQWGWHTVNAKQALKMSGKPSAPLCVIDSGVDYNHPDIKANMWRDPVTGAYGHDFANNDADPMDDAGHGTHVAGVASAANRNGIGMASVSGAPIMAVKVLAADGAGTELDLAAGIDYCVSKGARVISMSLSTPEDSPAVRSAVENATAKGAILVAAAGNTGQSGEVRYPAAYPQVIAVAAIMPDGRWAPFSTVASYVDIAAPGFAIVSAWRDGGYRALNGTSMAAPHVSGAAALLLNINGSFTATDVKAILGRSAIDLGPPGPDAYVGFGFLRADLAAKLAHQR